MKTGDILGVASRILRKHIFRFAMNVLSITVIILLLFVAFCIPTTIAVSGETDMEGHLSDVDNIIHITLNGIYFDNEQIFVTLEEADGLESLLNKYGVVTRNDTLYDTEGSIYLSKFTVVLDRGEYAEILSLRRAVSGYDNSIEHYDDNKEYSRISGEELTYIDTIQGYVRLASIAVAVLAVYLTVLVIGILKNNAMINIYDNIDTFAMMRCLGMEQRDIVTVSMFESTLCSCIAGLVGAGLSFAFISVIESVVSSLIGIKLYDIANIAFSCPWWAYIVYVAAILILTIAYFALTLTGSLRRRQLLRTLKRE